MTISPALVRALISFAGTALSFWNALFPLTTVATSVTGRAADSCNSTDRLGVGSLYMM